jgi:hypothetical protein
MPPRRQLLSKFAVLMTAVFLIFTAMHSARADSLVVTVRDVRSN